MVLEPKTTDAFSGLASPRLSGLTALTLVLLMPPAGALTSLRVAHEGGEDVFFGFQARQIFDGGGELVAP